MNGQENIVRQTSRDVTVIENQNDILIKGEEALSQEDWISDKEDLVYL